MVDFMNHDSDDRMISIRPVICSVYFNGFFIDGPLAGTESHVFGLRLNSRKEIEVWHGYNEIDINRVTPEAGQDFSFDAELNAIDVLRLMEGVLLLCGLRLGTFGLCTFFRK
jgi:hypothetical protein